MTTVRHLECSVCRKRHAAGEVWKKCECGGPLMVRYDLERARKSWNRGWVNNGPATMWRYQPVLPVRGPESIVSLGEGLSPMLPARRLARCLGGVRLWIKDEGVSPTGTAHGRGMACAVSMARGLGIQKLATMSGGNDAVALAAYAAAAGIPAQIAMPIDASLDNYVECRCFGAEVTLVEGPMSDCEKAISERQDREGWFNVDALEEPYRIEGMKTVGYEIAEQLHWSLPDVIVCPAGSGLGLIGLWKAFEELGELGWVPNKRPRMVAVQASGCQPLVRAFEKGMERSDPWESPCTLSVDLRVSSPPGDALVLDAVRKSGGAVVAVKDRDMLRWGMSLAADEGVFAAPEGGACLAGLEELFASGQISPEETIVVVNTGSGRRYKDAYATRFARPRAGEADKLGGLITPR